jgi:hypothetical protein
MTELSGTLDGLGLPGIVRFLGGLNKRGCLRLNQQNWQGDIFFDAGRVTDARLGTRVGLAALDAMVEILPEASFTFESCQTLEGGQSIDLSLERLLTHLDEAARRIAGGQRSLPSPDAVPTVTMTGGAAEEPVQLDRGTLQTLMAVDGERDVQEIIAWRGSSDALWQLSTLVELGLVRLGPRAAVSEPVSVVIERGEPQFLGSPELAPPIMATVPFEWLDGEPVPLAHCPKLGIDGNPDNSLDSPTRSHCCFANGRSMPLSLDQQRELCFSVQFATCPRLVATATRAAGSRTAWSASTRQEAIARNEPRIVRLPVPDRPPLVDAHSQTAFATEPRPLRPINGPRREAALMTVPTPVGSPVSDMPSVRAPVPPASDLQVRQKRRSSLLVIPIVGIAVVALAVLGYFLLPQPQAADPAPPQATPAATTPPTSEPILETPVQVDVVRAAAQPPPALVPPPAAPAAPAAFSAPVFDEHFTSNDARWPSDPQGATLVTNGMYRITPRQAGQFVGVAAPAISVPADVLVNATFRKLGGPAGGGYGIIVRDQAEPPNDSLSQNGHYYVLEAGDKGEIGIWRRDSDHWVDLLPWQHSDAVKPGTATNELSVRAVGDTLSLVVNGTTVATRSDSTLVGGRAGVFVGGDGNQVAVSRFTIQAP